MAGPEKLDAPDLSQPGGYAPVCAEAVGVWLDHQFRQPAGRYFICHLDFAAPRYFVDFALGWSAASGPEINRQADRSFRSFLLAWFARSGNEYNQANNWFYWGD